MSRDRCRQSDGALTTNGITLPIRGRCACRVPLYTKREEETGRCCECEVRR